MCDVIRTTKAKAHVKTNADNYVMRLLKNGGRMKKNSILDLSKYPSPPKPPPCRKFKDIPFIGLIETKESKQKRKDYEIYINNFRNGINGT